MVLRTKIERHRDRSALKDWLRDVFTKLPCYRDGEAFSQAAASKTVTSDELDELLPDRWLLSNP